MTSRPPCRACRGPLHPEVLDLGSQPLCNRFLASADAAEATFPQALAVCGACGLVQLLTPVPAAELASRFPWITYTEAEGHLDALVERLTALGALPTGAVAGGTTYKDSSTLARCATRGARTWEVGADALGLPPGRVEIDAVQERLTEARARVALGTRAPADLLLARHVLEHAHDLAGFCRALAALVRPGGWLVFEVPDSESMLRLTDYTPIWEEHVLYFTRETLPATLARLGFDVVETLVYPHPFENALVVIARRRPPLASVTRAGAVPAGALEQALAYVRAFGATRRRHAAALEAARVPGRPVALLGAGHLGCTWLNLMGLAGAVDLVVDDDPHRAGLFLPGNRLPIVPSATLVDRAVGLCLLGVNLLSEDRVVERNRALIGRGGVFRSIFPASRRALVGSAP